MKATLSTITSRSPAAPLAHRQGAHLGENVLGVRSRPVCSASGRSPTSNGLPGSKPRLSPAFRGNRTEGVAGQARRLRWLSSAQQAHDGDASRDAAGTVARKLLVALGGAAVLFTSVVPPFPAPALAEAQPTVVEAAARTATPEGVVQGSPAYLESKQPIPSARDLSPEELTTVRLFQENTPCVVNIANIVQAQNPFSMDIMSMPQGQGTGFVWDSSGHIVTNFHVIRGASEVRVALIDQSVYPAKIIGGDASKDIAVLQLVAPPEVLRNLKPVSLGQSSTLFVGQKVLAIGNPFGLDHTLTSGIISGLNRQLATGVNNLRNVIQTDAAINPGNSGGPLLDSKGRLIGINTAIADPSGKGSSSGVGFAIPIDDVKGLVDQILKFGRVVRPLLGVTIAPPQALRQLGLQGVLVLDVSPGSPAGKAGLVGISKDRFGRVVLGDVIVGIKGEPVRKEADLFDVLDHCKIGERVEVEVLRQGRTKEKVTVVLGERLPDATERAAQ